MLVEFAPQCCDAHHYIALGRACAGEVAACWDPLRPMGAVLYFSLPFRLGLPVELLIVLNALCLVASTVLGSLAIIELLPRSTRVSRGAIALACLLVHGFFMERAIYNSLSDVPAAAAAMSAIWLLILGGVHSDRRLYATAGLALGIAVSFRAYYLYPALLVGFSLGAMLLLRKLRAHQAVPFWVALALPLALQYYVTHARTGAWTFIDKRSTEMGEQLHFENTVYGYDTLLRGGGAGFRYEALGCFEKSQGMADAVRKHEWGELGCLLARRQRFYFGSFVLGGRVYLSDAEDRRFSGFFLLANASALLASVIWIVRRSKHPWLLAVPGVLLGAIWGQGSLIIPESRFLMAFNVVLWVLATASAHDTLLWLTLRFGGGRDQGRSRDVAGSGAR